MALKACETFFQIASKWLFFQNITKIAQELGLQLKSLSVILEIHQPTSEEKFFEQKNSSKLHSTIPFLCKILVVPACMETIENVK